MVVALLAQFRGGNCNDHADRACAHPRRQYDTTFAPCCPLPLLPSPNSFIFLFMLTLLFHLSHSCSVLRTTHSASVFCVPCHPFPFRSTSTSTYTRSAWSLLAYCFFLLFTKLTIPHLPCSSPIQCRDFEVVDRRLRAPTCVRRVRAALQIGISFLSISPIS